MYFNLASCTQMMIIVYIFAVYIDAADNCNMLNFKLGNNFDARHWNITVMQYDEEFINLAPPGSHIIFGNL